MSRAEKFIKDCTSNCSNEYYGESISAGHGATLSKICFTPWLSPDQALRAVEIAREEIYEWLNSHNDYIAVNGSITRFDMEKCIKDLKQAMNYE